MQRRFLRPIAWTLLLSVFAACRDSAASGGWRGTVETLPNGAEQVQNPSVGMWGDDDGWSIIEEVRLGSIESDGPEMFGEVVGLELDDLGRIYVLDAQAKEVRVFDAEGSHVRTFGRQGGGPGEFGQPSALFWGGDGNLWVVDQRNAAFIVYDTAGTYVTSHPRQGGIIFMPWPGGVDKEGYVHDITILPGTPFTRALVRMDADFQPADTFRLPEHRPETFEIRTANRVMQTRVPFSPFQVWELAPDGDVWMGMNDSYRINRVSYGGDTLRIVEREFEPVEVSGADLAEAEEELQRFVAQGGEIDMSRAATVKPAFRDLTVDEHGFLWVRPSAAAGEEDFLFDVFDPQGRYLGQVRSDFPISPSAPLLIRGDTLLAVSQNDLGVAFVVRARIEGRE